MARAQAYRGALEAIDRILNRGGDPDDVLREVVGVLHDRAGFAWAGIVFVEKDELRLGPQTGATGAGEVAAYPISFDQAQVGELRVASAPDDAEGRAFLERVALLVSPYCLVGWDTGGEAWNP